MGRSRPSWPSIAVNPWHPPFIHASLASIKDANTSSVSIELNEWCLPIKARASLDHPDEGDLFRLPPEPASTHQLKVVLLKTLRNERERLIEANQVLVKENEALISQNTDISLEKAELESFLRLVRMESNDPYNIPAIVNVMFEHLPRECDKNMAMYIKSKPPDLFQLIRQHSLFSAIQDKNIALIKLEAAKAFLGAASNMDDYQFAIIASNGIAADYKVEGKAVVLFKKFDDERADLTEGITGESAAGEGYADQVEMVRGSAKEHKGQMLFVTVNTDEDDRKKIPEFFGMKEDEFNTIMNSQAQLIVVPRCRKIQKLPQSLFNEKELYINNNPDEAIAYGAAAQAAVLTGDTSKPMSYLPLLDMAPHSQDIETAKEVTASLIERNTTISTRQMQTSTTYSDNQSRHHLQDMLGYGKEELFNHSKWVVFRNDMVQDFLKTVFLCKFYDRNSCTIHSAFIKVP